MSRDDVPVSGGDSPRNPFADDPQEDTPSDDPFAAPRSGGYTPYLPDSYETGPGRGGTLLAWAIVGLGTSIGGTLPLYLMWMPLNLLGLAFSVTAFVLATGDLRAIAVGAIDEQERGATRIAQILGMLGLLAAILPLIAAILLATL